MDLSGILSELKERLAKVNESIIAMERLAGASGMKPRGRPPAWLKKEREAVAATAAVQRRGQHSKRSTS